MTFRDARSSLMPHALAGVCALLTAPMLPGCADGEENDEGVTSAAVDDSGSEGTVGDGGPGETGGETGGADETTGGGDATDSGDGTDGGDCQPNPTDPSQYVIVGFWNGDPTCSGDPIKTNAFPVDPADPCYCWPGNSGMNSADGFMCDAQAGSFTYTQYNSLTCGAGDDTPTEKTTFLDSCTQDIPMNLYSKIVDFGACGG